MWTPDGKFFVTSSFDDKAPLCLWNHKGELQRVWKGKNYRVGCFSISADGTRMVAASYDSKIHVYDLQTRDELYSKAINVEDLTSLNISQDCKSVLISRSDNEVQTLDIDTLEVVRRFTGHKQDSKQFIIKSAFGGANEAFVISGSEGKREPSV